MTKNDVRSWLAYAAAIAFAAWDGGARNGKFMIAIALTVYATVLALKEDRHEQ